VITNYSFYTNYNLYKEIIVIKVRENVFGIIDRFHRGMDYLVFDINSFYAHSFIYSKGNLNLKTLP
jgi:hypothetical protein